MRAFSNIRYIIIVSEGRKTNTMKYVQIETTSTCNQRCFFCPVSIEKKDKVHLSDCHLEKMIAGLKQHSIEKVVISGFTEPTYDKSLVNKVTALRENGFKVEVYSNGSGLKAELTDRLLNLGISVININISTMDEGQYKQTRGTKDLKRVINNLNYLLSKPEVENKEIQINLVIIGKLDQTHAENIRVIDEYYGKWAKLIIVPLVQYAGKSPQVIEGTPFQKELQGCLWDRHKDWIHFNADGDAIFCCHDYQSRYKLGSIDTFTVDELLNGENIQLWRNYIEGVEDAPQDFLCRKCFYSKRKDHIEFLQEYYCKSCFLPDALGKEDSCSRCGDVGQVIIDLKTRHP